MADFEPANSKGPGLSHRMSARHCVALLTLAAGPAAYAAHPVQTEDTGTQGVGRVELENGLSRDRDGSGSTFGYRPQLSVGILPNLDLLLQPSWLKQRPAEGDATQGWGDTNLDVKWRFADGTPLSYALRAGIAVPGGRLGLRQGTLSAHALLAASVDAAPFALHGNLGLVRNPAEPGQRRNLGHVSMAAMWAANDSLTLALEAAADSNGDRTLSSWPAAGLVGAIWTLRPGLDVDVGYQTLLRTASPARSWLLGLTYRFTP